MNALGKREKYHLSCIEPRFLGCAARSTVSVRTELSEFAINSSVRNTAFEIVANLGRRVTNINKGKDKAIPLQSWTGPEGSRSLRLPNFKTVGT